jgi:hypothetical protein
MVCALKIIQLTHFVAVLVDCLGFPAQFQQEDPTEE